MIVLLSMRIVASDQCPCLNMCVIKHGFFSCAHAWWSIISLDFDFNQQDIRKNQKGDKKTQVEEEKMMN
jgi:hypothetical protein